MDSGFGTCHIDYAKLNDFRKASKDAGFKLPKDDESYLTVQPVMLGAPAQKELRPKTIWPGTIGGADRHRFNNWTARGDQALQDQRRHSGPGRLLSSTILEEGQPTLWKEKDL